MRNRECAEFDSARHSLRSLREIITEYCSCGLWLKILVF